jgi:hypothetical protein
MLPYRKPVSLPGICGQFILKCRYIKIPRHGKPGNALFQREMKNHLQHKGSHLRNAPYHLYIGGIWTGINI